MLLTRALLRFGLARLKKTAARMAGRRAGLSARDGEIGLDRMGMAPYIPSISKDHHPKGNGKSPYVHHETHENASTQGGHGPGLVAALVADVEDRRGRAPLVVAHRTASHSQIGSTRSTADRKESRA